MDVDDDRLVDLDERVGCLENFGCSRLPAQVERLGVGKDGLPYTLCLFVREIANVRQAEDAVARERADAERFFHSSSFFRYASLSLREAFFIVKVQERRGTIAYYRAEGTR